MGIHRQLKRNRRLYKSCEPNLKMVCTIYKRPLHLSINSLSNLIILQFLIILSFSTHLSLCFFLKYTDSNCIYYSFLMDWKWIARCTEFAPKNGVQGDQFPGCLLRALPPGHAERIIRQLTWICDGACFWHSWPLSPFIIDRSPVQAPHTSSAQRALIF